LCRNGICDDSPALSTNPDPTPVVIVLPGGAGEGGVVDGGAAPSATDAGSVCLEERKRWPDIGAFSHEGNVPIGLFVPRGVRAWRRGRRTGRPGSIIVGGSASPRGSEAGSIPGDAD